MPTTSDQPPAPARALAPDQPSRPPGVRATPQGSPPDAPAATRPQLPARGHVPWQERALRGLDRDVLRRQDGVVTRRQLRAMGVSDQVVAGHVRAGRWQRLHSGVFLTDPRDPGVQQRIWAGVLAAGDGAVASHHSAAALLGLLPPVPGPVMVSVENSRQPRRQAGLVVRRRQRIDVLEGSSPPTTDVLDTVLDLVADCREPGDVATLVTRLVGRRGVTAQGLRARLAGRPYQRHRAFLLELTEAVADGVRSALELRYRRDVELAHGLPQPSRQRSDRSATGLVVRDMEYVAWGLLIELDGRLNHADRDAVLRDLARDNDATVEGRSTLRYGWVDVAGRPCLVASQVAEALSRRGWAGFARRCGARCTLR